MNQVQPDPRTPGRPVALARALWILIAIGALAYYVYWSADAVGLPLPSCTAAGGECNPLFLSVEDISAVESTLLPIEWIARSFFVLNVLTSLVFILVSFFIAWRRPDDLLALWISTILLCLGAFGYTPDNPSLVEHESALYLLIELFAFIGYFGPITALFYFPDGRFVPPWSRWVCLGLIVLVGTATLEAMLPGFEADWIWLAFPIVLLAAIIVGVGCMVYRFRRVAGPVQRQQIKWVAFGLFIVSSGVIAWSLFGILLPPTQPSPLRTGLVAISFPLVAVASTFLPISVAVAMVRYRLWDIDVIIRRTIQYALLTGLLVFLFFGGIIVLQRLVGPLTGDADSPFVTVVTTLGIAALFTPLRKRVQQWIDRRFYRSKFDSERILTGFARAARDEVDLDRLTASILGVIEQTMRPERASLWLNK